MVLPATSPNRRAGKRGGGVLHPPLALGKARQHRHRALQQGAHGSRRQRFAMQPRRPLRGVGLHGDIERGLVAERDRDVARDCLAVMGDPARQQPRRNIERLRFDLVDQRLPLARAAAQHRIDEPGIFRGAPVRLHQPHRQIDRGMIGHVHPENLRGADQEARFARAARRSGCRDRAAATAHGPACRAAAKSSPPAAASGRGRGRKASSVRDARRRHRAARRACGAYAARRREYPLRSAAPQDRALRMAGRIVEGAWSGNISGEAMAVRRLPSEEKHLCHANMPNVRIAFIFHRSDMMCV